MALIIMPRKSRVFLTSFYDSKCMCDIFITDYLLILYPLSSSGKIYSFEHGKAFQINGIQLHFAQTAGMAVKTKQQYSHL